MTAPQNISLFESCNGSMQVNSALEGANNAPNHAVFFIRAHERGRNHILGGGQFFVGLFVPCVCDPYNFSSHPLPQIENGSVWLQKKDRRIDGRAPLPKPRSGQVCGYTPLSPKWRTVVFCPSRPCAQSDLTAAAGPQGGWKGTDRPNGFSLRTLSLYGTLVIFHLPMCCSRWGLAYGKSRNAVKCGASRTSSSRESELIASES